METFPFVDFPGKLSFKKFLCLRTHESRWKYADSIQIKGNGQPQTNGIFHCYRFPHPQITFSY
jgi:hypothetical protein